MSDLDDIIKTASNAYPDGLIEQAAAAKVRRGRHLQGVGDGLAEFIARELKEIFDENLGFTQNVTNAADALLRAKREVHAVKQALDELSDLLMKIDDTKKKDLPLLIGTLKHPVAEKYLEQKIKEA